MSIAHVSQAALVSARLMPFLLLSSTEGLFANANVLFRARFRDGVSIVERHATKQSARALLEKENHSSARTKAAPTRKGLSRAAGAAA